MLIGRKYLAKHDQKRRMVWVPVDSPVEPPKTTGGRRVGTGATQTVVVDAFIRVETVEVFIFAEDEDTIEALFDNLLGVMKRVISGGLLAGPYRWLTEEDGGSGWVLRQPAIMCRFSFRIPVPRESKAVVILTGEDHTCEYE